MAADAAYGVAAAWDFFAMLGRDGPDNHGSAVLTQVNYGGNSGVVDNAQWNRAPQNSISVRDGSTYLPYASLPVLAHEFTHGVTQNEANLIYAGEPGGLNEATSDFFGVMTDTWVRGGRPASGVPSIPVTWELTRVLVGPTPTVVALRYLDLPSRGGPQFYDAWSAAPAFVKANVHYSSGPLNRALFLLSQGSSSDPASPACATVAVPGIGNDAATRIWYHALTRYLTPSSNYLAARSAALRATQDPDLFPPGTTGAPAPADLDLAVRHAFAAVNVGDPDTDDLLPPTVTAAAAAGTATPSGNTCQLTATAASSTGVSEVDFLVDQVLVGYVTVPKSAGVYPAVASVSIPQLDTAHLLANGGHKLTAMAFSTRGNAGTSPAVPFTVANPVQQLLTNPGLEGGGSPGWAGDADLVVQTDFTGSIPHSGFRYASFDRSSGRQNLALSQQVALPPGSGPGASARFSFWVMVQGNPTLAVPDTLQVQVQAGTGPPTVLDTLSSSGARTDWVNRGYNLTPYLGQTVTVSLASSINPGTGTAFLVDDFALTCSASAAQPQAALSLDPAAYGPAAPAIDLFTTSGAMSVVGPLYAQVTGTPTANVVWSIKEGKGALSPGPAASAILYLPPAVSGFYHVVATSADDPTVSAQASIQVLPALSLAPAAATLEPGAVLPFLAVTAPGVRPEFFPTGGTVQAGAGTGQYLYTAPAAPGSYALVARDAATPAVTASSAITVINAVQVTITPAAITMATGSSLPFSAAVTGAGDTSVTWTVQEGGAGGGITPGADDGPAVYTAPNVTGTFHVTATSVADPSRSATATVDVPSAFVINPSAPAVLTGATVAFTALAAGNPAVLWSLPGGPGTGSIDALGTYTAPGVPGVYAVQAAVAGGSPSGTSQVTVKTTNLSGQGQAQMNADDLAVLADAWGTGTAAGDLVAAADLNGDGVVDDQDVALFFSRFGGQ